MVARSGLRVTREYAVLLILKLAVKDSVGSLVLSLTIVTSNMYRNLEESMIKICGPESR